VAKKNNSAHTDRLRVFEARQTVHNRQVARRKKDQLMGIGLAVAAVTVASLAYWGWSVGPGAPDVPEDLAGIEELLTEDVPEEPEAPETIPVGSDVVPDPSFSEFRTWEGDITIDGVTLAIELDGEAAPQAVANFVMLAKLGFFDDTRCHRLTTSGIFVLQCGDPTGTGNGGPDYRFGPIENAPEDDVYRTGTLAMARVGGDASSMGSQFFIVWDDSTIPSDLAGGYTVFGTVTQGMSGVIDQVVTPGVEGGSGDGAPVATAVISSITIR
jgi:peptidyl-prolyl cis-trans isomerase B (cyclophilin B)